MDPKETLPKFKSAAIEALKWDDTLAEAHGMLGVVLGMGDFDWAGAEQEFHRALQLNPASPIVRYYHGFYFLRPMGRLDEALSQLQRAVDLDPLSAIYNTNLGCLYYAMGQYDSAIAHHRRAMDLDPGFFGPHWLVAIMYLQMGRLEEAIAANQKACELSGRNAWQLGGIRVLSVPIFLATFRHLNVDIFRHSPRVTAVRTFWILFRFISSPEAAPTLPTA